MATGRAEMILTPRISDGQQPAIWDVIVQGGQRLQLVPLLAPPSSLEKEPTVLGWEAWRMTDAWGAEYSQPQFVCAGATFGLAARLVRAAVL